MDTLFENIDKSAGPIAFRLRPASLDSFVGQQHLLGEGMQLKRMIETGRIFSLILFGPPGSGKTALAGIISNTLNARIEKLNAVNSSVKEIRDVLKKAHSGLGSLEKTVLIIDEIHRFSRNQQEALLPDVEEGTVTLIGITTENPFYFISGPLLSRARVFRFNALSDQELRTILLNAADDDRTGLGNITITDEALLMITRSAGGDARYALNILETSALIAENSEKGLFIDIQEVEKSIGEKKFCYDRTGDRHYETISAFIKSIRGSEPDAAVFYLAVMLAGGEDPRFIARRMAISASEDIGNADPRALILADSALRAVEYIGMPEARIILAQTAIYLATAPKSNASYAAINSAMAFIEKNESSAVPRHLTKAGSSDYKYPHDYKHGYVKQTYMEHKEEFYKPVNRGYEKIIAEYLDFIKALK
ncbi:MAG: replication-associated recombination protein A [Elusimicrobiota bacterium]